MLLNASYKLTSSGLPPDLLDAYVRYKRSTRALLTWFQQQNPTPDKTFRSLTIKELESLAQKTSENIASLPDVVHFHFQEAITDRNRLSKYYRTQVDDAANDVDTLGHEHFTAILGKVYTDLCARFGDHKVQNNQKQKPESSISQSGRLLNHYASLTVEEATDHEEQDKNHLETLAHSTSITSAQCPSDRENAGIHLTDDELGTALEVMAAHIQDISSSIDHYWAHVGKGAISFAVASFMTNVAFASLRQVVNELLQHHENIRLSDFFQICCSFRGSFETELRARKIIGTNTSLLSRLQHIEGTLSDRRDDEELFLHDPSCPRCGQKTAAEVHSKIIRGSSGSRYLSSAITENIVHWVSSEIIPVNTIMSSTPVYSDVAEGLITEGKNNRECWSAVLGLNLLTQSYRVYLKSVKQANLVPRGRITALKLAQQAYSQVTALLEDKTCFPCRCSQTLGYHLQNMVIDLHGYASHNCWDLVFQSPWVAGNHVLEILGLCNYYGHQLLKYRHYVGAVLHSYNVLTQLGGLEKISVLEKACSQFCETLFPGGNPPKTNFHACWARYVGARLKFKQGHKGKHNHDNWCLAIPGHVVKAAAGIDIHDHRHKDKLGCLLFHIKQQEYYISDAQWKDIEASYAQIHQNRKDNGTKQTFDTTSQTNAPQTQKQKQLPLAVATQAMFTGRPGNTLPVARVNLFAVFERCVRVVSKVSNKMHEEQKLGKEEYCVCFCSEMLTAADRLVKGRRLGKCDAWKKHERMLVDDTKEAILEAFGAVKEDELLWDV